MIRDLADFYPLFNRFERGRLEGSADKRAKLIVVDEEGAIKTLHLIILSFFISGCTHHLPDFTARLSTRLPVAGKAESIGEYSLGCLQGAQTFTGSEQGIVISQMKRGRYWGHPDLINILTEAGAEFHKQNKKLIIGDLGMSRGGPTLTGHASHQNGLDVDIWFRMPGAQEVISFHDLETENMRPISELGDDQKRLIKYFAQNSKVERIFINPSFKKRLCEDEGALKLTEQEQRKMRAWWGHDDHIHVRLRCPNDSSSCVPQNPIPAGDGCGEDLNWWFGAESKTVGPDYSWDDLKKSYNEKIKKLPPQCSFFSETF